MVQDSAISSKSQCDGPFFIDIPVSINALIESVCASSPLSSVMDGTLPSRYVFPLLAVYRILWLCVVVRTWLLLLPLRRIRSITLSRFYESSQLVVIDICRATRNASAHDNKNPYDRIIHALIPVPCIRDLLKTKDISDPVPMFNLVRYYRNNKEVIKWVFICLLLSIPWFSCFRRVLLLVFALSKTNLMNLALSDPTEFSVSLDKIMHSLLYPQSFFLIGSVVYSDLFGAKTTKQICIRPLSFSFPRVMAILSCIYGTAPGGSLYFNGYHSGSCSCPGWNQKTVCPHHTSMGFLLNRWIICR